MHKSAQGMIWTESLQQIIKHLQFNGFGALSQPCSGSNETQPISLDFIHSTGDENPGQASTYAASLGMECSHEVGRH